MTAAALAAALTLAAPADSTVVLDAVTVSGRLRHDYQMSTTQSAVQVDQSFIARHLAPSLMQTLDALPGVQAVTIGSGQSRPAIRGLGQNRLAVIADGIKHEGQQWGDDHGLEVDQMAIDRVEIVKGPAALLYGSDAVGGAVSLHTNHVPTEPFSGSVRLMGQSSNELVGTSLRLAGRRGRWFGRLVATMSDYGDARVPTDSIQYYSYWVRLKDGRLRNTAGRERDGMLTLGYAGYDFHCDLRVSDYYAESGLFADAHGLEVRVSDIDYDHSRRDIDLPSQWVNHLKAAAHAIWHRGVTHAEANLAWQHNLRSELSEPVSHGYMPTPPGTTERRFDKHTGTASLALRLALDDHELRAGLTGEMQHNRRGGWGFIIPDFETATTGLYVTDRWTVGQSLTLSAGLRYDYAHTHIHSYRDWYTTPTASGASQYAQRSTDASHDFSSLTWSAGVAYAPGQWVLKANVGKGFRIPIPKELGADGVNYHIFRYERGNPDLDPEVSYQADGSVGWQNAIVEVEVEPYVSYFPNYIYLSPTPNYVEGLQLYRYTQAEVLRWGIEAQTTLHMGPHWEVGAQGEYLYARQQSGDKRGYTLPFCPPWSADASVSYCYQWHGAGSAGLDVRVVGRQDEIVPPEKPTDGHWTLGATLTKALRLGPTKADIVVRGSNLLGRRYYDHTSYYRLIDVPEPGRNVTLTLRLDF